MFRFGRVFCEIRWRMFDRYAAAKLANDCADRFPRCIGIHHREDVLESNRGFQAPEQTFPYAPVAERRVRWSPRCDETREPEANVAPRRIALGGSSGSESPGYLHLIAPRWIARVRSEVGSIRASVTSVMGKDGLFRVHARNVFHCPLITSFEKAGWLRFPEPRIENRNSSDARDPRSPPLRRGPLSRAGRRWRRSEAWS